MSTFSPALHYVVIGAGRLGHALSNALRSAGENVSGPLGRDFVLPQCDVAILCVPESQIATVSASIARGPIVGHCSASFPLDALVPHERFVAHPLLPITKAGADFHGAACATDGSSDHALHVAEHVARTLGMRPVHVPAEKRALYHAAASMAANFITTLEDAAEQLAAPCGISRAELAPLARAALENWIAQGGKRALVGPVSRGETETVARQREAVSDAAPHLVPLWDALEHATRTLAASR